ncbi:MAG: winged helix-turn-helix domain-containing protein [Holosporaceae bacterium]|jgi:transposase|nr:winged helix-turn-helix domain-containing protein [Holosporaceae bacterium]
MKNFLTPEEQQELRQRHQVENNRRTADRIKAVLMSNDGWSFREISKMLLLVEETISKHVSEYRNRKKLGIKTGGSQGKLTPSQTKELDEYLEEHTYARASEICEYVEKKYGITYTVQGITCWLQNHGFLYKKLHPKPSEDDPEKQKESAEIYQNLQAVRPPMATKISNGWMKEKAKIS